MKQFAFILLLVIAVPMKVTFGAVDVTPADQKMCEDAKDATGSCSVDFVVDKMFEVSGKTCVERFRKTRDGKDKAEDTTKNNHHMTSGALKENFIKGKLGCTGTDDQLSKLADCAIIAFDGYTQGRIWKLSLKRYRKEYCCPSCCEAHQRRTLQESDGEGDEDGEGEDCEDCSGRRKLEESLFGGVEAVEEECPVPSGYGEPHFATWKGTHYNYHGACDLVLLTNQKFNNGAGIDLHARTEQMSGGRFSFFSDAALRIGGDVLEVHKDRTVHHNMRAVGPKDFPLNVGGFRTTHHQEHKCFDIGKIHKCVDAVTIKVYAGISNPDGHIVFKVFTDQVQMVHVEFQKMFYDLALQSYGMLGNFVSKRHGRVARDGVSLVDDPNDFGLEWQVRDSDPKLFVDQHRYPQFPEKCIPRSPAEKNDNISPARKLREDAIRQLAHNACDFISHDRQKHKNCIFDVMSTEDEAAAIIYHSGW